MTPHALELMVKINVELTLWQAIKLRIAGKHCTELIDELKQGIRKTFNAFPAKVSFSESLMPKKKE